MVWLVGWVACTASVGSGVLHHCPVTFHSGLAVSRGPLSLFKPATIPLDWCQVYAQLAELQPATWATIYPLAAFLILWRQSGQLLLFKFHFISQFYLFFVYLAILTEVVVGNAFRYERTDKGKVLQVQLSIQTIANWFLVLLDLHWVGSNLASSMSVFPGVSLNYTWWALLLPQRSRRAN